MRCDHLPGSWRSGQFVKPVGVLRFEPPANRCNAFRA